MYNKQEDDSEQERFLPIANISRIMKQALPPNAKISKEAKEQMQEWVSEFISFITWEACEKCKLDKRKTISGDDVLYALNILGYEKYMQCLNLFVASFREIESKTKSDQNQSASEMDQEDDNSS